MASKFSCLFLLLTFHLVVAYDRWALFQQIMMQVDTCVGSGYPVGGGCCEGPNCCSLDESCYCDRICHKYNDCCTDIDDIECSALPPTTPPTTPPPTTPPPTTPPTTMPTTSDAHNCVTLMAALGQTGCCNGSTKDCRVLNMTDYSFCYCNVECHASATIKCCDDIGATGIGATGIGCFPKTCHQESKARINKSLCCNSTSMSDNREMCRVQTASDGTFCFCDNQCASGKQDDCCPQQSDFCSDTTPAPQHAQPAGQFMQMKQMADLMTKSPFQDWSEPWVTNLWRRYRASLLAQLQEEYYHERPQDFPNFGK